MPLGNLDETLRHQLPQAFDTVGTSDPRFFDRYWFSCYDPAGAITMILGMGLYSNMNVLDGFVACQVPQEGAGVTLAGADVTQSAQSGTPTTQRNFRYSRALRPDLDHTGVGPLKIEILEPFKRVGITAAASDQPLELELEWHRFLPPKEEDRHFTRLRGRVTTDYLRYTQVGSVSGQVTLDGKTYELNNCWGGRDHSWGVRPQTAGPEPVTGPPQTELSRQRGSVFYWLPFSCEDFGGHVQVHMLGDGTQTYLDGVIQWPDGTERNITEVSFEVDFYQGTRRWSQVRSHFVDDHNESYEIVTNQLARDWAMLGTGYDWGWDDRQGLGVYRGEYYTEVDSYNLSHPEDVQLSDGEVLQPMHREAPAHGQVNGKALMGHQIMICSGPVPALGLG